MNVAAQLDQMVAKQGTAEKTLQALMLRLDVSIAATKEIVGNASTHTAGRARLASGHRQTQRWAGSLS